jgi:hypothetical protein
MFSVLLVATDSISTRRQNFHYSLGFHLYYIFYNQQQNIKTLNKPYKMIQ